MQGKTALVTGASAGIGEATVRDLLNEGAIVYAAARRVERMKDLEAVGARLVALDVTNEESMINAVTSILDETGRIDILLIGRRGAIARRSDRNSPG
ncbi:MAG: SDR family NAD(P)-dependent oxidoreductase [Spirochaetes bacterium]|nr:SDR family NAD(P)-dependent oxidoreductase [Spirochaetota bacterium]